MEILEQFKNLSQEDKNKIIDEYFKEVGKADGMTIIQYLFFKCIGICQESGSSNIKLESDLLKINKKGILRFDLEDL